MALVKAVTSKTKLDELMAALHHASPPKASKMATAGKKGGKKATKGKKGGEMEAPPGGDFRGQPAKGDYFFKSVLVGYCMFKVVEEVALLPALLPPLPPLSLVAAAAAAAAAAVVAIAAATVAAAALACVAVGGQVGPHGVQQALPGGPL